MAANAIVHSRSQEPGGEFTVRVRLDGRGLVIVGQLAARWGCAGHSQVGWTVWYELDAIRISTDPPGSL